MADGEGTISQAQRAGDAGDTFLTKPCLPPIALGKIREMLRLST